MAFENDGIQGWFAVIPSWPGPRAALAMVDGADTFLDSLSEGNPQVTLELSLNPKWLAELTRLIPPRRRRRLLRRRRNQPSNVVVWRHGVCVWRDA